MSPAILLYKSAACGCADVVRELLSKGALVDQIAVDNATPLCIAAVKGWAEVVRVLLAHGADVNHIWRYGKTPLILAAQQGHVDVVRILLNYGANVEQQMFTGVTPLSMAARHGKTLVVREILRHDSKVNRAKVNGATPLYLAAKHGHICVVNELLVHDANIHLANNKERLPKDVAANRAIKDRLKLSAYIDKLNKIKTQYRHYLFGVPIGLPVGVRLAAAKALKAVVMGGEDEAILRPHAKVLCQGDLAKFYAAFSQEGVLLRKNFRP